MRSPTAPVAGVPRGPLDLLVRAALAPLPEARACWRDWRAAYDIDTTPWNEVRLLGAVAARIDALEPDAVIRPRILGIRKFLWVQSQICLKAGREGLAAIAGAGIPTMLLKGGARIAADPSTAQERLIRDVDALVPLGDEGRAFEALERAGWALVPEPWQVTARERAPRSGHHAWSLSKGKAEIDLHHFSNHLNRLAGDDDGLWRRARTVRWNGLDVRVPSPADALLIAIVHGVRWSQDASADWAIDAAAVIDAGEVDWAIFLDEARSRVLPAILRAGLAYLRDALRRPVPDEVIATLEAQTDAQLRDELALYAFSPAPDKPADMALAAAVAARRALDRVEPDPPAHTPQGAGALVARAEGRLSPGRGSVRLSLGAIPPAMPWVALRARFDWPEDLERPARIAGQFASPGLSLPFVAGRWHQRGTVQCAQFECVVPRALLEGRGIEALWFRWSMPRDGTPAPAELTVQVGALAFAVPAR